MHLVTLNAAGAELAKPRALDRRSRRLSQVIGRHADKSRPFMVAVQRARDPLQPIDEAWVVRGRDKAGNVKPWPRMYLPADAVVAIVYLPRGGGGAASGGARSKSPLSIALSIAAVALIAFAGPIGGAIAGAVGVTSAFGISAITAGVVLGGSALLGLASKAKANKAATETTQVYGVSGGGNLPRSGDRIPRGYGRSWMKPDLSQPDFSQYDGDDQILFKRHTIGLGRYRAYAIRAGKQEVWREGVGFIAPFDDSRNAIEFVNGTASALVPNSVIAAAGVGGMLPRPADNPAVAGPFLINQRGALISRIQIDFQFPQGISRTDYLKSGTVRNAQPAPWAVLFEYAAINEAGAIIGPWQVLYNGNSGAEGAIYETKPLRRTKFKDVPPGRYAVRGRNVQPDTSQSTTGNSNIDAAQWDAASGWVADAAIRDGVTEMCLRLYATKGTQAAAYGEIEVDASAIIPVYTGAAWVEQETSKSVWAYVDIMHNQDYGGAIPYSQIDLDTALFYANTLTEFDTFDGTIRGPVSVQEAASTVLLTMRAEPVHLGRFWSFVRDDQKQVRRHNITRRQIAKGTTQVSFDLDSTSGAAHVIGEFDQDGDYRSPNQAEAVYGEASLTPLRQRWSGVRTFAHASHLTRWRAACGAFRRQRIPFGVEMEGRIYKRGDSIAIDPWFLNGRQTVGLVGNKGDLIYLDADVDLQPNDRAMFRDRAGRVWGPVEIVGQGTSPRQIVLNSRSRQEVEQATGKSFEAMSDDGLGQMTPVTIGQIEVLRENYLIQTVSMTSPTRANVEAVLDDPRVWEALGSPIVTPPEGGAGLADPVSPRIVGLDAKLTAMAAGWRLDYTIRPGRGAVRFEAGVSYDDGNRFDTRIDVPVTGSIDLAPADPTMLVFRVRAFGSTGIPGPYYLIELALPRSELNANLPPVRYEDLEPDILDRIATILAADEVLQQKALEALARADEAIAAAFAAAGAATGNTAAIVAEKQARLDADGAFAQTLNGVVARVGTNEAAIVNEATLRIDADGVNARTIEAVKVQGDSDRAFIIRENTARIIENGTQAQQIDAVIATSNSDRSYFIAVTDTLATFSGIYGQRIESLGAQYGDLNAQVIEERRVRADGDGTQAQRTTALIAQTDSDRGYFIAVTNALVSENGVRAQQTADLYARSDAGTATGRFQMEARSGPGGVTSRIAALVSTSRGGQTYGAGYFLDLMTDGSSRFVVDANAFYITNGGNGIPLLSFDGFTLRVPALQVGTGNIPYGTVNYPGRTDIYNYTLISGQGTNNNATDANMRHVFYSDGTFPTVLSIRGRLTVNPNSSLLGMTMVVDGAYAAQVTGGALTAQGAAGSRDFDAVAVLFLSQAFHTVQFVYSYQGGTPQSSVVINEIHCATVTARA